MSDNSKTIEVLKELIETCRDGQKGFKQAAEHVSANHSLKEYFFQQSQERGRFAAELTQHLQKHDKDAATSGSFAGAMHRAWIDIKGTVTSGDDHTVLESVEQGEDSAKKAYEEALKAHLPADLAEIVRRQFANVKAAHDHVRDMRDKTKKVA